MGRLVKATATFTPDSNDAKAVPKGLLGKVAEIDENGDAWIAFEGLDEEQGVLRENFGNNSVLSQEGESSKQVRSGAKKGCAGAALRPLKKSLQEGHLNPHFCPPPISALSFWRRREQPRRVCESAPSRC